MSDSIQSRILSHLQSGDYQPAKPRHLARELELHGDDEYPAFRQALRQLMDQGRVVLGQRGALVVPGSQSPRHEVTGTYSHNRRGFGFVTPSDPTAKEDLFIPPGDHMGAMTGDTVRARIASRGQRDGKSLFAGKIVEIVQRGNSRFVGELVKVSGKQIGSGGGWYVLPDGNALTQPISTPDAAGRHIRPGTKVVVELTEFPDEGREPVGVITQVLGEAGEKDVDLRSIIIQHNLPEEFPREVLEQARLAVANFEPETERRKRIDLSDQVVITIDPDDAKDYDDAISLRHLDDGKVELGVHIADVSHFVPEDSPLDTEARQRGNSCYFPGFVIPMLPEVLSNGVCSLMEAVPRLTMSAFITIDREGKPAGAKFAQTLITSAKRLRYREAQDLIDGKTDIFHPEGNRKRSDYAPEVLQLLEDMNDLSKRIQRRRLAAGQLVLDLPEVDLVLNEDGKVVGTAKEDQSFTHTLIEMFMVEANEAVARLLDSLDVPFLRRIHPEPDLSDSERLQKFVSVAGHRLPKEIDRHAIQKLVMAARGRPEAYAINLAVLKSLTRAEYSPERDGHYALASTHYTHFTSPIRRYTDLMIHRLLRKYIEQRDRAHSNARRSKAGGGGVELDDIPSFEDLVQTGRHLSFTERRAEDAERELRQVKILTLLENHIGEDFPGVVTGIASFGIFVQLTDYLIEGLIRYEDLLDDWWDVDEQAGIIRGQRTGKRIGIGDTCRARIARVDPARRELTLAIAELTGRVERIETTITSSDRKGGRGARRGGGGGGGGGRKHFNRPGHKSAKAKRPGTSKGAARGPKPKGRRGKRRR
jgi:ribonuclease R